MIEVFDPHGEERGKPRVSNHEAGECIVIPRERNVR